MSTVGPLIALGVLISLAGQTISVCYHADQSEVFPTGVRCHANGIVYSASRLVAMMSGFNRKGWLVSPASLAAWLDFRGLCIKQTLTALPLTIPAAP